MVGLVNRYYFAFGKHDGLGSFVLDSMQSSAYDMTSVNKKMVKETIDTLAFSVSA